MEIAFGAFQNKLGFDFLSQTINTGQEIRGFWHEYHKHKLWDEINELSITTRLWIMKRQEKIIVVVARAKYTNFPDNNRYYPQIITMMFDASEYFANEYQIFQTLGVLKQYSKNEFTMEKSLELEIKENVYCPKMTLIQKLESCVRERRTIVIQVNKILENEFVQNTKLNDLFASLSMLPIKVREQIDIIPSDTKFSLERYKVSLEQKKVRHYGYYTSIFGVITYDVPENSKKMEFFRWLAGLKIGSFTQATTEFQDVMGEPENHPEARVMIHYGDISELQKKEYLDKKIEII